MTRKKQIEALRRDMDVLNQSMKKDFGLVSDDMHHLVDELEALWVRVNVIRNNGVESRLSVLETQVNESQNCGQPTLAGKVDAILQYLGLEASIQQGKIIEAKTIVKKSKKGAK